MAWFKALRNCHGGCLVAESGDYNLLHVYYRELTLEWYIKIELGHLSYILQIINMSFKAIERVIFRIVYMVIFPILDSRMEVP